jgi:ParB family chromosome partitioning protein
VSGLPCPMQVELEHLDRRYEGLRTRSASRERKLVASLAELGQQSPIIVVRDGDKPVVVDGYKRVRALRRLGHDVVEAVEWSLGEADALLLEHLLRGGEADSAIEQGWLLLELSKRFGLGLDELSRRFDRTKSWVSRRLGLVNELPARVQEHVREGAIGAHAAMKYLVPLARANEDDCVRLSDAIAPLRLSNRQIGELYATYVSGGIGTRDLLMRAPMMVLEARAEVAAEGEAPAGKLLDDLHIVTAVARRAHARLVRGAIDGAGDDVRENVRLACSNACDEVERLTRRCKRELGHAGPNDPSGDPPTAS